MSSEIESYKYFKKYDPEQFEKYEQLDNKKAFKLKLRSGDFFSLVELPTFLSQVPVDVTKTLSKIPPKYKRGKRKIEDPVDSFPESCESVAKKPKLVSSSEPEVLSNIFASFVTKVDPTVESVTTLLEGNQNPEFHMICGKCAKKVKISYKVTKGLMPCFVKTNWLAHKCNKAVQRPFESENVDTGNDDSGLGFE